MAVLLVAAVSVLVVLAAAVAALAVLLVLVAVARLCMPAGVGMTTLARL
jgi:hypothetical protein